MRHTVQRESRRIDVIEEARECEVEMLQGDEGLKELYRVIKELKTEVFSRCLSVHEFQKYQD
jgi:hypothetical protein